MKKGKIYVSMTWAYKFISKNEHLFGDFPLMVVEHPKNKNKIAYQLIYK
jgi:hypothetical protein